MGPKTKKLIEVVDKLILILNDDDQKHWSNWMSQAKNRLIASDFSGIEKVLSAYGGMGSSNDICLSKVNRTNENFSELQNQAWELATDIKHEYEART